MICVMLVIMKRVLFENCKALWMDKGKIIFLHKWNFSAASKDIMSITVGTYGRFNRTGIFLLTRDGTKKIVPIGSLEEPDSVVIARLKECALTS